MQLLRGTSLEAIGKLQLFRAINDPPLWQLSTGDASIARPVRDEIES